MIDERLSVYIDGELGEREAAQVCERLLSDPAQHSTWTWQHLIRDCLRGDADGAVADTGFAERVARVLEAESQPNVVVPLRASRVRRRRGMYTGLAVAASLALAAVLVGIGWQTGQQPASPVPEVAATDPTGVDDAVTTVSSRDAPVRDKNPRSSGQRHALDEYLIEHQMLSVDYGMAGATPSYARVTAAAGQSRR